MYNLVHIEHGILRGEWLTYLVAGGFGGKMYSLDHDILMSDYPVVTLQEEG